MSDELSLSWLKLVFMLIAPTKDKIAAERIFNNLVARYNEPSRHYHTLEHITKGIQTYTQLFHNLPPMLELFAWLYHDAVYETTRSDNESQSAAVFMKDASALGFTMDEVDRIVQLILATDPSAEPLSVVNDIDLAELGATPEQFDANTANIRKEYHWVEPEVWRKGRAAILTQLLKRDKLYVTETFANRFDFQAKENLKRAIAKLTYQ